MTNWTDLLDGFGDDQEHDLITFIANQRWYSGKDHAIAAASLLDIVSLREKPGLVDCLVEIRSAAGTTSIYQLVIEVTPAEKKESSADTLITTVGDLELHEASDAPELAQLLTTARGDELTRRGNNGEVSFQFIDPQSISAQVTHRLVADQSNTSIVIDGQLLLKLYRLLEPGINPELEMSLFLTEHGFPQTPRLSGWYGYAGVDLRATLGVIQRFLPDAVDGWSLGLEELGRVPDRFLERLERLGEVVGTMHCVLASEPNDPDFAPEEPSSDAAALLGARIEQYADSLADSMPEGRADAVGRLTRNLTDLPLAGRLIRCHGDLHLGQVLWSGSDWFVTDFEGEPVRSLNERRRKAHPLRDVAGIFRSLDYLVAVAQRDYDISVSPDWQVRARGQFLSAYRDKASPAAILPSDLTIQDRILRIFEIEKILYEFSYEMRNRPELVEVPLQGIDQLLASDTA